MSPAETIWRFELTGSSSFAFEPGDSAEALLLRKVGSILDPVDAAVITVHDPLGLYTGYFDSSTGGTRGFCRYMGDFGRWEIFSPSFGLRTGKATANWTQASIDTVTVNMSTVSGTVLNTDVLTVNLPVPPRQDPAVYTDQVIWFETDIFGNYVCQGMGDSPLYSLEWLDVNVSAPTGWIDADGGVLPVGNKVSYTNAPDYRGKYIMHKGTSSTYGEDTIGNTLGFRLHGQTENNHPDHDNHRHQLDSATYNTANVAAGTDFTVIQSSPVPYTSGQTTLSGSPSANNFDNHLGPAASPYNDDDTDNRPPTRVSRLIFRHT
jgi:hypothetical protein